MNGVAWNMKADDSRLEQSARPNETAPVLQPYVPSVWEGRAGFGEINCVCAEARLRLPAFSTNAGILHCSFEEHSFPVEVKFGRVFRAE